MAAAVTKSQPRGFYIQESISGLRMLVDTIAMHLVFSSSAEDCSHAPNDPTALVAANGTPIRTYGSWAQTIAFLSRTYTWPFVLADVWTPLLGADFLAHQGLLVDVARHRLLDTETYLSRPLARETRVPTICSVVPHHRYTSLLQEFLDVFHPELRQVAGATPKHSVFHHIETKALPTHAKFRRLPLKLLQEAKTMFKEMEKMGSCKKALSPWASPLHMVKKTDGRRGPAQTTGA
ncbi:uncharacterized protein LOC135212220 [Macrobrachium nipponense]|uniref:uncharacterized protein LOC135212220 n=1 Tax=Macrobrachium nipponense TaxID=159736 RepID=UPI0030C810C6